MRLLAAVALATIAGPVIGWGAPAERAGLTGIGVTLSPLEVVIESTGPLTFRQGRLSNPSRAYFDFPETELRLSGKRTFAAEGDGIQIIKVRAAETAPGTVRVVFDLANDTIRLSVNHLEQPARLVVTVKSVSQTPVAPPRISLDQMRHGAREAAATGRIPAPPAAVPEKSAAAAIVAPPRPADAPRLSKPLGERPVSNTRADAGSLVAGAGRKSPANGTSKPPEPAVRAAGKKPAPDTPPEAGRSAAPKARAEEDLESAGKVPPATATELADAGTSGTPVIAENGSRPAGSSVLPRPTPPAAPPAESRATPARRGSRSLTRALGLKLGRIVLDPGHGGNDFGTSSPNGLHEKELVLDVAQRLGLLLEEQLGAEVIYTREDDRFVALERRTEFANEQKADLFISVHANSSPFKQAAGPETYFLNFTSAREALEVASRENASSGKTIFELKDLLQKIALNEKLTESRDFAAKVQSSMMAMTKSTAPQRDRGVKRAPFVVLIGAQMPSILTEIGFVSNPREEALLKRSDYRRKIAEALAKGVVQYATSLSRFQVAHAARAAQ